VLVTVPLVALVTWLLLPPEKTGGPVQKPSTFFNVGYGTKAAYLVLERLEYPVGRLRRPITEHTLDGIGCLFILKPLVGLESFELDELKEWVSQGHALVVVPGRSTSEHFATEGQAAPEAEEPEFHIRWRDHFEDWFNFEEGAANGPETPGTAAEADRAGLGTVLDAGEPICAGIRRLTAGGPRRFAKSPVTGFLDKMPVTAFWKDKLGTVGLRVQCGEGTIVALAEAYPLTNLGISDADNGLLLGNIARELSRFSPGEIAFDEYHHGFVQRDWTAVAMTKLMLTGPGRWAAAQALLVAVLGLYAGAVRFGSPRDVTPKPRRQQREFAEAAGRLLDEAGATTMAAETLTRYYRDRLCRALHLEPDSDDARLSRAVRERSGQEIAGVLKLADHAKSRAIGRKELLTIAQQLHRVTETLDHGT
jgi:hypothetical protein